MNYFHILYITRGLPEGSISTFYNFRILKDCYKIDEAAQGVEELGAIIARKETFRVVLKHMSAQKKYK